MDNIVLNIVTGFSVFPYMASIVTLAFFAAAVVKNKVNFVKLGAINIFALYLTCVIALVFFPLPDAEKAAELTGYSFQPILFKFVSDIVRESGFRITDINTYLPAFFSKVVWQVLFNVVMTVPFGMFAAYYFKCSFKTTLKLTFAFSCFIEFGQLTGLFWIYNGSYRVCDVDDLLTNTLGGALGYGVYYLLKRHLPELSEFDISLSDRNKHKIADRRAL